MGVYSSLGVRPPAHASRLPAGQQAGDPGQGRAGLGNVAALGLTSLVTDISSEMVVAVLPLYLTLAAGFTTVGYGIFEGAYRLVDAVFRLVGASWADTTHNHKRVAASGYALSASTRLGLLASTMVAVPVLPFLLLDRVGKGIRSTPRDALISLSVPRERLGMAFGVHRTMDTTGAMLGPFAAFALLWLLPGAFDSIFVVSFGFAVVGVLVISLLVQPRPVAPSPERPLVPGHPLPKPSRATAGAVRSLRAALGAPAIKRTGGIAFALGLVSLSDAFLYLVIQRHTDMNLALFPLLFAATALIYLLLATPIGALADRVGRGAVFAFGHLALLGVYIILFAATADGELGQPAIATTLFLLGVFYASTDGVLPAVVSAVSEPERRTSAIAVVSVAGALGRFVSSVAFGTLWLMVGIRQPLLGFAVALALVTMFAGRRIGQGNTEKGTDEQEF